MSCSVTGEPLENFAFLIVKVHCVAFEFAVHVVARSGISLPLGLMVTRWSNTESSTCRPWSERMGSSDGTGSVTAMVTVPLLPEAVGGALDEEEEEEEGEEDEQAASASASARAPAAAAA